MIKGSIVVVARNTRALATQYTGQEEWGDDVKKCTRQENKLKPIPKGFEVHFKDLDGAEMGYQIRMGEFIPIKHGDWVVSPHGSTETFVFTDEEFHNRYITE